MDYGLKHDTRNKIKAERIMVQSRNKTIACNTIVATFYIFNNTFMTHF